MQHHAIAMAMPRPVDQRGLVANEPLAERLIPPYLPRTSRGLSGRPTCRIYARGDVWVLELDAASGGWLDDSGYISRRLAFPTLAAAIGYAERHGLDYRIERPRRHPRIRQSRPASGRLPRSWLARLARNGRNGDIYHG
jgi:hypothetical protein